MSRLILEGDLISNFGDLLPIPYIDMITINDYVNSATGIRGYKFDVEFSMLFTLPEHDPNLPTAEIDLVRAILDKINISLMFTKSSPDYFTSTPLASEGFSNEVLRRRARDSANLMQHLENTTGANFRVLEDPLDELSLVKHDPSVLADLFIMQDVVSPGISYDIINVTGENFERNLNSGRFTYLYDKKGRKFIKIKAKTVHELTVDQTLSEDDYSITETMTIPVTNPTINLLAFTSMHTLDEITALKLKNNEQYTMFFSDVAYEEILRGGKVKNQTSESFFDDNREVYPDTPFESLNGRFYKADTTTHKDVYSKFNNLLDSYISILPNVPADVEGADPELVGSVEVIQYALENYKDKIDLLPQINKARKQIINRSIGTRSGALFSDMATMLGRVDSIVQRATPLTKKLTINAKIIDRREMVLGDRPLPEPVTLTEVKADDMIGFQYGRTILFTSDEYSTFNIYDYIDQSTFAGFDIGDGLVGPFGTPRQVYDQEEGAYGVFTGKYDGTIQSINYNEQGQIVILITDPLTGGYNEVVFPDYAGYFDETFAAKKEYNQTNGFVTVDWQTLLIDHSVLSTLVDVRKFVQAFGLGPIKKYFVPHKAILRKNLPIYTGEGYPTLDLDAPVLRAQTYERTMSRVPFDGTTEIPAGALIPVYSPGTVGDGVMNNTIEYGPETSALLQPEDISLDGATIFSYMTERNVSFLPFLQNLDAATGGTGIEAALEGAGIDYTDLLTDAQEARLDHRLMYFEFQNFDSMSTYMDYDKPVMDFYKFEFTVLDFTKSSLVDVIKHYYFIHFALKNYLEDAGQECSYNTIDGVFNDFFAEEMRAAFSTNPAAAPWIFCPVVYIRHIDFLTNKYGGEQNRMLIAAREIIQKISPETGTLENLRAFYQNFIGLYTGYYAPGTTIGNALSLLGPHDDSEDDYAYHYGVELEVKSAWNVQENYSSQNENERDQFLSLINEKRYEYETISELYRREIANQLSLNEQSMRRHFQERDAKYAEKMRYEVEMTALKDDELGYGCYYCMWWDAWDHRITFGGKGPQPGLEISSMVRTATNEFGYVYADGVADHKYGYYWIGPHNDDQVFERYPIETYGPPTEYACFPKDIEISDVHPKVAKCRYLKTAYMLSQGNYDYMDPDHALSALDEDRARSLTIESPHGDYTVNAFGAWTNGTQIGPFDVGYHTYTRDYATNLETQRLLLDPHSDASARMANQADKEYEVKRQIPGFESIYYYRDWAEWLADYREGGEANLSEPYSMNEQDRAVATFLFGHARFSGIERD